jgi:chaperonin GroES
MAVMISQQDAVSMPATPTIKKKFKLDDLLNSPNIAQHLNRDERMAIGKWVIGGYAKDLSSRTEWANRHAQAMKIALQVKEMKSFPWTNASNVKFPLVTIGALQFLARISIMTKGNKLVNLKPVGADPKGEKAQRAERLSTHLSMQLTDDDMQWADADEQTKFAACLLGSSFKKKYFDPVAGRNVSEFVPAQYFVVDYNCTDIETAGRASQLIPMTLNKVQERIARGVFLEEEEQPTPSGDQAFANILEVTARLTHGLAPNAEPEELRLVEQYGWLDLDGDGYKEPYIFSVREDTGHLYRVVARYFDDGSIHRKFDARMRQYENLAHQATEPAQASELEKLAQRVKDDPANIIVRIDPVTTFTKYTFVPSPDGGFYGLGLGVLLGPVNEAVDTLLNQLIDSGTMSNTAGGWIARGAKIQAGKTSFDPFEWKRVDGMGDDLRKSIVPLPVRDPSPVLFQLLGILIQYGEKISSATDIMTGVSPGQNTPATTAQTTVEQGMMLFSGIYTRMYRSFRQELTVLYNLNRLYLHTSPDWFDLTQGDDAIIEQDDYRTGRFRIFPTADPSAISGQQRRDRANRLVQAALSPIGAMWDKQIVARKWLESEEWDVEEIFPDPKGPNAVQPPVDPKVKLEQDKLQQSQQEHHDNMMLKVADLQQTVALNWAKILELRAKAAQQFAAADSEGSKQQVAMMDAQIGALKLHNDTIMKGAELLLKGHQAKTGIEQQHHQMLMDVHDRLQQQEANDQTNTQPQPGAQDAQ